MSNLMKETYIWAVLNICVISERKTKLLGFYPLVVVKKQVKGRTFCWSWPQKKSAISLMIKIIVYLKLQLAEWAKLSDSVFFPFLLTVLNHSHVRQ